jgi:hypothetical protein
MPCVMCASENQAEFPAEMNIHFPGLVNLDKPSVWVFPVLQVCLDCGFSRLVVPEPKLSLLRDTAAKASTNGDGRADYETLRRGPTL